MKKIIFLSLLVFIIFATSCKKEPVGPNQPKPINLTTKANEVIAGSNSFGIDLFRLTAMAENKNMMLSPLSASTALTMLLNGCQTQTYGQIRDMLGYSGLTLEEINAVYHSLVGQLLSIDPKVKLALANSVWIRQGFEVKPAYLNAMDSAYDAEIAALDFNSPSALETINGWASDKTNGKIPKVLDAIDPYAVMFLMNALYFKGTWTYQFDPGQTSSMPFHLKNGSVVDAAMMRSLFTSIKIVYNTDATVIELPYGQQNFSMVIILPQNSLDGYLPGFDNAKWSSYTAGLDAITEPGEAEIILPKFKFEYEKKLNEQLKSLGMVDAFDSYLANLSGISDANIYVDFVKQNTFVDVNEEGTEAAAVTTGGVNATSLPPAIIMDKPFIFAIRERMTNALLFIGKVEQPAYQ
jgi:serpin B